MKKYIILTLFLLSAQLSLNAQDIATRLNEAFLTFTNQPALRQGTAAFHVIDSESGAIVYAKNSHLGLPPASTLKTITSITALDILGPGYTYQTTLYYTGDIDSLGVLHGDIVVQGSGDPTLGSNRFEGCDEKSLLKQWTTAIQSQGITQIQGRVISDDRLYNGHEVPGGWPWNDMGNYYGAGVSSLNWRENKVGVIFQTGSLNSPAQIVRTSADISYLQVINTVKVGSKGSGDKVFAYAAPYLDKVYLKGTYEQGLKKTVEVSIPDPAYDLAYQFTKFLAQTDIPVLDTPTTGQRLIEQGAVFPAKSKELHIHTSPKLSEIIYHFNHKSINLYGEALLKSIGQITGQKNSTSDAVDYLKKYWTQKLGISEQEINVIDGSGLSPQNFVTAEAMTKVLQYALSRPWYTSFLQSLPTINQMTMKSGTIRGTLGYTGYQTSSTNKRYTFTLLVYNYSGSAATMRTKMFSVLNNLK